MRIATKNTLTVDKDNLRESILKSMIASFKIEKINIPEKTAQEIYRRVRKRLKKVV
jgi:Cdc6-like AAA superfamily ATPase